MSLQSELLFSNDTDIKRDAFFYHLLRVRTSFITLRQQLRQELKIITKRDELTPAEQTRVSAAITTLTNPLNLSELDTAILQIDQLLSEYYGQHWFGSPEATHLNPTTESLSLNEFDYSKSVNQAELAQIDNDLAFLDFYLEEISQFLPFRQRLLNLATEAHKRFPRPNDLSYGYASPEQHLFDHPNALASAMSLDTTQPLNESTQTVKILRDRLVARKQVLLEAEQQKFSEKLVVQVATDSRAFIGMIIYVSELPFGNILTLISQSGEIIEHIPADRCRILNQQAKSQEFIEIVSNNWGVRPFELAKEWVRRFGKNSLLADYNPFAKRD